MTSVQRATAIRATRIEGQLAAERRRIDAFCEEVLEIHADRLDRIEGALSLLVMSERRDPIGVGTDLEIAKELDILGLPIVIEGRR